MDPVGVLEFAVLPVRVDMYVCFLLFFSYPVVDELCFEVVFEHFSDSLVVVGEVCFMHGSFGFESDDGAYFFVFVLVDHDERFADLSDLHVIDLFSDFRW